MRRPLVWLLGIASALFLIGMSAIVLTAPSFTRTVSAKTSLASEAGLPLARMVGVAEQVRRFVVDFEAPALPATVDRRPGFDAAAVSHLVDVRRVLYAARIVTGALAVVLALFVGVSIARARTGDIGDVLVAGAVVSVVFVALAVVAATSNFDAFFTAFHGLFFKPGTWTFPADSLLIETFPEAFWETAGVAWGALVTLGACAMTLVGVLLQRGATGASEASA